MKLYSVGLSPYASRVRLAIYAKALPVEVLSPPTSGTKSPEYLAINPLGKIPALVLGDGTVIPESDTIVEYLADAFPEAGLRPRGAEAAARARLLARVADLYVMTAGGRLFGQLNPQARDAQVVEQIYVDLEKALTQLNLFMTEDAYAVGDSLTTADCALVPMLFFQQVFAGAFGRGEVLAAHGKISGYWGRVRQDPAVAKVLGEMQEALAAFGKR